MHKLLLAAVTAAGLAAIAPQPASAAIHAPVIAGTGATAAPGLLTNVDYYWRHHHWHHRHWEHRHWRYYD